MCEAGILTLYLYNIHFLEIIEYSGLSNKETSIPGENIMISVAVSLSRMKPYEDEGLPLRVTKHSLSHQNSDKPGLDWYF